MAPPAITYVAPGDGCRMAAACKQIVGRRTTDRLRARRAQGAHALTLGAAQGTPARTGLCARRPSQYATSRVAATAWVAKTPDAASSIMWLGMVERSTTATGRRAGACRAQHRVMILLATQPLLRMTCPSIKIPLKYCTLTCTSLMNFSCPASCNSNNYIDHNSA
jgi:hypothetical protein